MAGDSDTTGDGESLAGAVPPEMRLSSPLPNLDTGFDIIIFEEQKVLSQQILWWGLLSD